MSTSNRTGRYRDVFKKGGDVFRQEDKTLISSDFAQVAGWCGRVLTQYKIDTEIVSADPYRGHTDGDFEALFAEFVDPSDESGQEGYAEQGFFLQAHTFLCSSGINEHLPLAARFSQYEIANEIASRFYTTTQKTDVGLRFTATPHGPQTDVVDTKDPSTEGGQQSTKDKAH